MSGSRTKHSAELKRQRDAIIEHALDSLEEIIEFTQKAVEHEELEKRIEALEEQMAERQTERSYR